MNKLPNFLLILLISSSVFAQDIDLLESTDEAALFGSDSVIEESQKPINKIIEYSQQKSVSFSGQIRSFGYYGINRNWLMKKGNYSWADNNLFNYTDSDFFLDIRLQKGVKAFVDLSVVNLSSGESTANATTALAVKELFMDFNLDRKVYVRVGKQFLKFGRTYFWNPVDFVNSERKSFYDMDALRSGTYGTKFHVPMGAANNFYMFVDSTDVENLDDFAVVTRYEFLWVSSEVGLSMWNRRGYTSNYGFDASTRFMSLDIKTEVAMSYGSNQEYMADENGSLALAKIAGYWVPKATVDVGYVMDWERSDRISLNYELYYNGDGYKENVLKTQVQRDFISDNNLYSMGRFSRWYQAFFINVSEFPTHSTTFSVNGIQNLVDYSSVIMPGFTYQVVDGFKLASNVYFYFGDDNTEYLLNGNALQFQVSGVLEF